MSLPLVSIVINNYNYERYVADSIESALRQTYSRCEVVVVDDGSSDGSRGVIAQYGDRIIPILKTNGGQASAMNAGIAASSGDLIIFLDSDDILLPHAVESLVRAVSGEDLSKIAKIQWRVRLVDAEGRDLGRVLPDPRRAFPPRATISSPSYGLEDYSPPTSGNAFSRQAITRLSPIPTESYRICADAYINAVAPIYGDIVSIDATLSLYRIHGANGLTGRTMDIGEVRRRITIERSRERDFRRLAPEAPRRLFNLSDNLMRIASVRAGRAEHPLPQDDEVRLWRNVLYHLWLDPRTSARWSPQGKLGISLWVTASAFSPQRVALSMFEALMDPQATHSKMGLVGRVIRRSLSARTR